jgi:hypothetical protein
MVQFLHRFYMQIKFYTTLLTRAGRGRSLLLDFGLVEEGVEKF